VELGGQEVETAGQYVGPVGHFVDTIGHCVLEAGHFVSCVGHVVDFAGHVVSDCGHLVVDGGHCVLTDGHRVDTVGQVVVPTGHTVVCAGHRVVVSGHLVEAFGQIVSVLGQRVARGGQLVEIAGHRVSTFGQLVTRTGHSVATAGQVVATPGVAVAKASGPRPTESDDALSGGLSSPRAEVPIAAVNARMRTAVTTRFTTHLPLIDSIPLTVSPQANSSDARNFRDLSKSRTQKTTARLADKRILHRNPSSAGGNPISVGYTGSLEHTRKIFSPGLSIYPIFRSMDNFTPPSSEISALDRPVRWWHQATDPFVTDC
jgi:hypothetical protein